MSEKEWSCSLPFLDGELVGYLCITLVNWFPTDGNGARERNALRCSNDGDIFLLLLMPREDFFSLSLSLSISLVLSHYRSAAIYRSAAAFHLLPFSLFALLDLFICVFFFVIVIIDCRLHDRINKFARNI